MAKETVAALYTKLGLDLSDLDSDFALADKTVTQAISRLNHESKKIKIETDIDLKQMGGATSGVRGLAAQEKGLTAQLELQRQKISLVNAAYQQMIATKGRESAASARLETRLLNERKAYTALESQLKSVQRAKAKGSLGTRAVDSILAGASAKSVIGMTAGDLGLTAMMASPWGRAAGVATAVVGGITAMAKSAMTAGNNVYLLAQKMHTTTAEASRMNMVFKLAGADVGAAVPAIIRLDKAVETAGETGNQTTRVLSAFGVNLKDASGNLLPVNQQLTELAKGYRNAAAAGLENEYVSQVLGARGAELVPVLQQMNDLQERAARIPTTGLLNPDQAHKMATDYNELKVAMGQISGSLSAAVMPVVADAMPEINKGTEELVRAIKDNKAEIKEFVSIIGSIGSTAVEACGIAADAFKKLGGPDAVGVAANFTKDTVKQFGKFTSWTVDQITDTALWDGLRTAGRYVFADYLPKSTTEPAEEKSESSGTAENTSKSTQDAEDTKRRYEEAVAKAKAARPKTDISDEIYRATHNDLQNQLHDIDQRAAKLRAEGVDEQEIVRLSEAQKAKIYKDFNDNTVAQINRTWKSELQNRLDDIDREKRAWEQKGIDEVTATKWAESEKGKARQQAGLDAIKQQKQYLDIYRQAMAGPGTAEEKQNNARIGMLNAMRKQYGIQNERVTPDELMGFTDVMATVKNNLVPGLETSQWAKELSQNSVQVFRGGQEYHDVPGITNNITINGGIYTDERGQKEMADQVAAKILNVQKEADRMASVSY